MKKKIILVSTLTAVFALGIGLTAFKVSKQTFNVVEAQQHIDNYAEYTYSGNYYSAIDGNQSEGLHGNLRKSLSSLILPKAWFTYGGSQSGQLGKELQSADQDPTNSSNMVMFYTRDSVSKRSSGSGSGEWNREHVWPRSLSNNNWSASNGGSEHAGADILHVRPTWYDTNETRGSIKYGDVNKSGPQTYNNMTFAYISGSRFEPLDAVKGDVARILMYVWTAYYEYYNDSGLVVTKAIESYDTLLKWHTMDKPDALEGVRNNFAESSKQKNRNPFVDHPEYAWKIFGDSASATVKQACKEAYPAGEAPAKTLQSISISGEANKKNYYVGESFDPTGLTVTALYSDSSSTSVPLSNCSWSPNPLTLGTTTITCTYNGKTATYSGITISEQSSGGSSSNPTGSSGNSGRDGGAKKGCAGSITLTTLSVVSLGSVVGLVFIFSKKRK